MINTLFKVEELYQAWTDIHLALEKITCIFSTIWELLQLFHLQQFHFLELPAAFCWKAGSYEAPKGQTTSPKRMNFRKSSKLPLTPLSFSENHIADFASKLWQKWVCSLWWNCCVLYDPISHEMHVVQQFNVVLPLHWLKTYPKKTLLYHFHAEKALFKGPKSAI